MKLKSQFSANLND